MSLQDDIITVKSALKGSSHPDWPEPKPGSSKHAAWMAFWRICDGMPAPPREELTKEDEELWLKKVGIKY